MFIPATAIGISLADAVGMLKPLALVCLLTAAASAQANIDPEPAQPTAQPASAPMMMAPAQQPQDGVGFQMEKPAAQNSLYLELGGSSLAYSLNYERFVRPDVAIRVGFSYMSVTATAGTDSASASWLTIPVMAEYLGIHSGSHALELGAGVDFMYFSGKASTFDDSVMASGVFPVGAATIGYRYSDPKGGFLFRAAYTPLIIVSSETKEVVHWAGVSFGYRF